MYVCMTVISLIGPYWLFYKSGVNHKDVINQHIVFVLVFGTYAVQDLRWHATRDDPKRRSVQIFDIAWSRAEQCQRRPGSK